MASHPVQPYWCWRSQRHPISLAMKVTTTLLLSEPDDIVTSLLRKLASVSPGPMYRIPLFFFFCYVGKWILEQSTSQKLFFLGNSEFLQGLTIVWMLRMEKHFINTWFFNACVFSAFYKELSHVKNNLQQFYCNHQLWLDGPAYITPYSILIKKGMSHVKSKA